MEAVGGLANVLQTYGGWGVAAVLCFVVYRLWSAYEVVRNKNEDILKTQSTNAIALVEEMTKAVVEHKSALERVAGTLGDFARRLENVEKKLE